MGIFHHRGGGDVLLFAARQSAVFLSIGTAVISFKSDLNNFPSDQYGDCQLSEVNVYYQLIVCIYLLVMNFLLITIGFTQPLVPICKWAQYAGSIF